MSEALSDDDKNRIRSELRYVTAYLEARAELTKKTQGLFDRVSAIVSNAFVLLIVGSIITSFLIPRFQKAAEDRAKRAAMIQDCLAQFLQYSLSRYEEMMAVDPLGRISAIEAAEYDQYMQKLSEIRWKRYVAFAKIQATASLIFGRDGSDPSDIEKKLKDYAVKVQSYSNDIDSWIGVLYCAAERCVGSVGSVQPRKAYNALLEHVHDLDSEDAEISALIITRRAPGEK